MQKSPPHRYRERYIAGRKLSWAMEYHVIHVINVMQF